MTISNQNNKVVYTGDGVTTTFSYSFRADSDGDIKVYLNEAIQVAGYTLTRELNNEGGNIEFDVAPSDIVTILRSLEQTQEIDYTSYGPFPAETHELGLDKLTMIVQQLSESISRTAITPIGDPNPGFPHSSLSGLSDPDVHPLSSITNTPAGNISATTGQAAINQLDAIKEPADSTILKDVNVGTGAGDIVALDGSGKLPAVDGSQLTNIIKAKARFDRNGATSGTVIGGVSIARLAVGRMEVTLPVQPDEFYNIQFTSEAFTIRLRSGVAPTTTGFTIETYNSVGARQDYDINNILVM